MSHPIENIMQSTMEQLRQMVDVNTIVGEMVETGGGTVLLPVSKVSIGFVSGGGEYGTSKALPPIKRAGEVMDGGDGRYPFAGTAAAGISLTPMAFVSTENGRTRVLPAQYKCGAERLIDLMPEIMAAVERIINSASKEDAE